MSTESDLFDTLSPLVANRVRPLTFLQSGQLPTWPAIRYEFISQIPTISLCGSNQEDTNDIRVQIDPVHTTFVGMRALRLQVIEAMRSFTPPAVLQDGGEDYDAETKTYRARLDYIIYRSSTPVAP